MKSAALALILTAALLTAPALLAPAKADESTPLVELCEQFLALPKGGEVTSNFIQLKSSCAGFINSHVRMSKPEDGFCRPKNYNIDDLAKAYIDWIKKHPERIKDPTKVTMTEALIEVFPCPK